MSSNLNVEDFITNLQVEDILILVRGDGTLNHFANLFINIKLKIHLTFIKQEQVMTLLEILNQMMMTRFFT